MKEVLMIIITAVCNGLMIFLFQLYAQSKVKKNEEINRYKKEINANCCKKIYEIVHCFKVEMELCFHGVGNEPDEDKMLEITEKIYIKMLELNTYYGIYREVLNENAAIKDDYVKISDYLEDELKPLMQEGDKLEACVETYNKLYLPFVSMANKLTTEIIKYNY